MADFICLGYKIVLEIDGEPHFNPEQRAYDSARDEWMKSQGFTVIRVTGKQVELETEEVFDLIEREIKSKSKSSTPAPHPPTPSPRVRGEEEPGPHPQT